jgi:hypothetical protein
MIDNLVILLTCGAVVLVAIRAVVLDWRRQGGNGSAPRRSPD